SERWAGDLAAQAGKAALAAWTASSTSPGVDSVKLAMTSPVLGSRTSSVSVEEPATDLPSITFGTVISVMGLPFGVVYLLLGIGFTARCWSIRSSGRRRVLRRRTRRGPGRRRV